MEKTTKKDYIFASGRRRLSTAEVRIYKKDAMVWGTTVVGKGEIIVNNKKAIEYFGSRYEKVYKRPLQAVGMGDKLAVAIKVVGGGKMGQLDASVLAIARALDKIDKENHHKSLKKIGLLTRDSRIRERRKVGMGGKSRRRKQSPKR